jgi:hypothetical protein
MMETTQLLPQTTFLAPRRGAESSRESSQREKGLEKGLEKKRDFVYLISKCSMLYIHLDIDTKRGVLDSIKEFIEKLQHSFLENSVLKSLDQQQKKEKILSALIPFLQNLTTNYMIEHITLYDNEKRDFIIKDIEISSYNQAKRAIPIDAVSPSSDDLRCSRVEDPRYSLDPKDPKRVVISKNTEKSESAPPTNADWGKEERIKGVIKEKMDGFTEKVTSHIDQKVVDLYDEIQRYFEKKFAIENEKVEKGLSRGLGDHRDYAKRYMDDVTRMIREEIAEYVEGRNEAFVEENYGRVRDEIRDKVEMDLETLVKSEISAKVEKLTHILNKNLESSIQKATSLNYDQIQEFVETKIHEYEYMIKNTPLTLSYDKSTHTLHLIHTGHGEEGESGMVLSSIQLPAVAGPAGPAGPQGPQGVAGPMGPQGASGLSPVLKNLDITRDGHLSVMVQDSQGTYELKSLNRLPMPSVNSSSIPQTQSQAQTQVVEKRVSVQELNFEREHVMRLDSHNENTLIILKSLSIGENSHCVKPNSVAVGGATCFQENSLAIGPKAQAIARNSVALYGSTSGENAFAYRATNVPSNQLVMGSAHKEEGYNIQKIVLNAEHIHLNSNNIRISAYEEKIRGMEAKIEQLEKMMAGGVSQRYAGVDASVAGPSGSRQHQSSSSNANMGGYGGLSSIASLFSPAQPVHEVFYESNRRV